MTGFACGNRGARAPVGRIAFTDTMRDLNLADSEPPVTAADWFGDEAYDARAEGDRNLYFVAPTFEDFLERLHD
ncbi:hypothetical protein GCM10008959_40590 [Deinococcus seoulensis]|uniref:SMI1/KNR4 family protein n=2 Tax=Deinococcus seoulensis TaxID=1837379 RepID=A0ABQ2RWP2_9DEIO|nr:hypothetical protein GCM10008959_40590 [Deinococcus seoulensis]